MNNCIRKTLYKRFVLSDSMVCLIASKKDPAGMNIAQECEKLGLKVHYIEEDIIFAKNLPESDFYIFLSRHKSESEMPCLTAHFPGVYSKDTSHGGNAKELGIAYPSYHTAYLKNLKELHKKLKRYQLVTEPTHHGPTHFHKPIMFVEIGSSKKEWEDTIAGEIVAKAVYKTIQTVQNYEKTAIAFGGTHYSEKFTNAILNENYAIGHIAPKYALKFIDENIFKQMKEKSVEPIKYCLIDQKGCNRKSEISEMARNNGLEVVRL